MKRKRSRKLHRTEEDDDEEQEEERPKPCHRQHPVVEESKDNPPLQLPAPRSARPSQSSHIGAVEETRTNISAAESSTNLIRLNRARDSLELHSDISNLGEGSSSRRPQRKRVKAARLQEYNDGSIAGPRRTPSLGICWGRSRLGSCL